MHFCLIVLLLCVQLVACLMPVALDVSPSPSNASVLLRSATVGSQSFAFPRCFSLPKLVLVNSTTISTFGAEAGGRPLNANATLRDGDVFSGIGNLPSSQVTIEFSRALNTFDAIVLVDVSAANHTFSVQATTGRHRNRLPVSSTAFGSFANVTDVPRVVTVWLGGVATNQQIRSARALSLNLTDLGAEMADNVAGIAVTSAQDLSLTFVGLIDTGRSCAAPATTTTTSATVVSFQQLTAASTAVQQSLTSTASVWPTASTASRLVTAASTEPVDTVLIGAVAGGCAVILVLAAVVAVVTCRQRRAQDGTNSQSLQPQAKTQYGDVADVQRTNEYDSPTSKLN